MTWFILCILLVIILITAVWFWAVRPGKKPLSAFTDTVYAHRGLWDRQKGIPENSLPAFAAACEHGYGIELDVHITSDGRLVVFHDNTTKRMCSTALEIEKSPWSCLAELRLDGTSEHIPLFSQVLALTAGRVPLLIELKLPTRDTSLCPAVLAMLQTYEGPYIIESFNPFGLQWFRKNAPGIIRGQLSTRFPKALNLPAAAKWLTTMLLVNCIGRPDFIAYSLKHADQISFRLVRKLFRVPVFFWTIRNEAQLRQCRELRGTAIFEQIRP